MKKYTLFLLLAVAAVCFSSCHSQNSRVDGLRDFVEEIQKDGQKYTSEEWEKANARFSQLLDKINSYTDLTQEELEEVARLQANYAAAAFRSNGKNIMEQMEKSGVALDSLEEGFEKGMLEGQE